MSNQFEQEKCAHHPNIVPNEFCTKIKAKCISTLVEKSKKLNKIGEWNGPHDRENGFIQRRIHYNTVTTQAKECGSLVAMRAILPYVHYKFTAKRQMLQWICILTLWYPNGIQSVFESTLLFASRRLICPIRWQHWHTFC